MKPAAKTKRPWPKHLAEQAGAIQAVLASIATAASANDVAKHFGRATETRVDRIEEVLETLTALGKARELKDGRYVAV